jgi:processive 1,2-diacylglycerol beta-glucosyltransferase
MSLTKIEEKIMTKVLFLPFLQIPSGHHQVVTTLTQQLQKRDPNIQWEKVDILSYTYKYLEPLISTTYLKWIHYFPAVYHWIYKKSVYQSLEKEKQFKLYELLFLHSMKKLIQEQQPHFIICSHALPSYLSCKLKQSGDCDAEIINVYTDYFIHHIWGTKGVNAHYISLPSMREYLTKKGVDEKSIYQTGIPIHHQFHQNSDKRKNLNTETKNILVTGGSLGVGKIEKLLSGVPLRGKVHYFILCGNNKSLYQRLSKRKHPRMTPYQYITSKEELNTLYNAVDAVLTKPGGVTISECLYKRLPIIIYDHLPGQEKINVDALTGQGLISVLHLTGNFEEQLIKILTSSDFINNNRNHLNDYHNNLISTTPVDYITQKIPI